MILNLTKISKELKKLNYCFEAGVEIINKDDRERRTTANAIYITKKEIKNPLYYMTTIVDYLYDLMKKNSYKKSLGVKNPSTFVPYIYLCDLYNITEVLKEENYELFITNEEKNTQSFIFMVKLIEHKNSHTVKLDTIYDVEDYIRNIRKLKEVKISYIDKENWAMELFGEQMV